MKDKNQKYEKHELKEVKVTTQFKDEVFPTRLRGMNKILVVRINDIDICYLCMDMIPWSAILHLYLPEEHRNTNTINKLVKIFYSHVHPWCKDNDATQIIVNCSADDAKTTELFKTFGFMPETINIAIMRME